MHNKYLICNNEEYLTDRNIQGAYPISYPLVIAHSFWNFIKHTTLKEKYAFEAAIAQLSAMALLSIENDFLFYEPHLFEIFSFNINVYDSKKTLKGVLFIDRSEGCFPLILYPLEYAANNGFYNKKHDRILGFEKSLQSVYDHAGDMASIFNEFKQLDNWDLNLQDKIADVLRPKKITVTGA